MKIILFLENFLTIMKYLTVYKLAVTNKFNHFYYVLYPTLFYIIFKYKILFNSLNCQLIHYSKQ